jgi:hypothetical protein
VAAGEMLPDVGWLKLGLETVRADPIKSAPAPNNVVILLMMKLL